MRRSPHKFRATSTLNTPSIGANSIEGAKNDEGRRWKWEAIIMTFEFQLFSESIQTSTYLFHNSPNKLSESSSQPSRAVGKELAKFGL